MRFFDGSLALLALSQAVTAQGRPASSSSVAQNVPPVSSITGRPLGLITTAYVTATVINQIEVVSICATNGAITIIIQEQATCETYTTRITIPASLCSTFVSTQSNGVLTTCTTPVQYWTQILPTAVTSKVQSDTAYGANTAPPGYGALAQTGSLGNHRGQAGAQRPSPASQSPAAAQTTYATAGAPPLPISSRIIWVPLVIVALV